MPEMPPAARNKDARTGFTLVELSIVLVIIGLVVGGVLVGRDLITHAMLQSQIKQIEKFKTAHFTFRTKYEQLPGDLNSPAAYNFGVIAGGPAAGLGDNDGCIQGSATAEATMYWRHLGEAGLIEGRYDGNQQVVADRNVGETFPIAKIGRNGLDAAYVKNTPVGVIVLCAGGVNYYQVGVSSTSILYGGSRAILAFTPGESYLIDTKIDDGKPLMGRVVAMDGNFGGPNTLPWMNVGQCVDLAALMSPANIPLAVYLPYRTGFQCGLRFEIR